MLGRFTMQCPNCKEDVVVQSNRIHALNERILILEGILRANGIEVPKDLIPDSYGRYMGFFYYSPVLPDSVVDRKPPILLEDKTKKTTKKEKRNE